jgi:hypothetical protein
MATIRDFPECNYKIWASMKNPWFLNINLGPQIKSLVCKSESRASMKNLCLET